MIQNNELHIAFKACHLTVDMKLFSFAYSFLLSLGLVPPFRPRKITLVPGCWARRSAWLSSLDYARPDASTESRQCGGDAAVVRGPLMEAGVLRSVQLVVVMKQWH